MLPGIFTAMEVSDVQLDDSDDDRPTLLIPLDEEDTSHAPLAPICIVLRTPRLAPAKLETPPESADTAPLMDPATPPAVIDILAEALDPADAKHNKSVSDNHPVASAPLPPTRALPVYIPIPYPDPSKTRDAPPVPTTFDMARPETPLAS